MIELVPIKKVTSPYGEKRFKELSRNYIEKLKLSQTDGIQVSMINNQPIIVTKFYEIVDGHHRYLALKELGLRNISVIRLNCLFEDTAILRDFQKHLKGMVPETYETHQLKDEFDAVLPWIIRHLKN